MPWRFYAAMSKGLNTDPAIKQLYDIFDLLKVSLWGESSTRKLPETITQTMYEELKMHLVHALPANLINSLSMPKELYEIWYSDILKTILYHSKYTYEQKNLPITVPYVILKGTSAALYYPYPELRTMGDIDIMTSHQDFDTALKNLLDDGYKITKQLDREIGLIKNRTLIELHMSFSSLSEPEQAKYLDDLIINNITPTHILPDLVNGIVIIEHAYKHLEGGLGLRQIIDWMMFVDKCLPDERWPEFKKMIQAIGLEQFTIVTTRMCELYLGLSSREWCKNADTSLCRQLMDYVMSCGNFGNKRIDDQSLSENVFAYARTPKALFQILQKQGKTNWKAAQKHKILQPFAWIYQAGRYIFRGLNRDDSFRKLKSEFETAKKRNAMFDALGIKKISEGRVSFKNGKYIKK